jgi:hypothetical protein
MITPITLGAMLSFIAVNSLIRCVRQKNCPSLNDKSQFRSEQ